MKYPYIGKGTESGSIVLFYEQGQGVTLDSKSWASENLQHSNCINEDLFDDITREYLANTYGEVKSEEHAEFIVELAKGAGIALDNKFDLSIYNCYFAFRKTEDSTIRLGFYSRCAAVSRGEKLITLPLPPKEGEDNIKHYPQAAGVAAMLTLEQLGYTYHGGELWKPPLVETIKESEGWLISGCECIYQGELYYLLCKSPFADVAVITKASSEDWDVISADFNDLEKPPTPEEELESKLSALMNSDSCSSCGDIAKAIINGEIKGLSYEQE